MKKWVIVKVISPFDTPFLVYLKRPRKHGCEVWDEERNAKQFTFWEACWQGLRHWAWPMQVSDFWKKIDEEDR